MRKFIIAGMAVAMLAIIPAAASADVPRCEAPVTQHHDDATFTAIQPANGTEHQWERLDAQLHGHGQRRTTRSPALAPWTDDGGADGTWTETITGSSDSDIDQLQDRPRHRRGARRRRDVRGDRRHGQYDIRSTLTTRTPASSTASG